MKRWHVAALFTLALVSPLLAAEAEELARLDQALKAVATYDYDKDASPLRQVEDLVVQAAKDPKLHAAAEQRLLRALTATKTEAGKAFLCRQLRTIGTARAVPQLAALLADPKLAHMARYALGRIEAPEAVEALYQALAKTSGKVQVGILNTLANRRCQTALPDFIRLLGSNDAAAAQAAARALGLLGGADATKALQAARPKASGRLAQAIDDALLRCADQLLKAGQTDEAVRIYQAFYSPKAAPHLRVAGLRGLVAAWGPKATRLLVAAIRGDDRMLQASAIGLVRTAKGKQATRVFANLLPALPPDPQVLLLGALSTRGDAAAAPAILAAAKNPQEAVRVAALEALGHLGDAANVELLVGRAATAGGAEQQAARAALRRLPGDGVNAALVKALGAGEPKVRVERIGALAARRATQAVAELLKAARDDDPSVRAEALRALGALAGQPGLPALVGLALKPREARDRAAVEAAIAAAFRRVGDADKQAAPLLEALPRAPADAKPTFLRLLGRTATPKALEAIRAALKDDDKAVKGAAVRALADWPDPTPAEDLLALMRTAAVPAHKVLALRGYVRMAGASKSPTAMYVRALELAERPEDKKLVLGGLGTASSPEALRLVERYLKDPQLQAEAAMAVVQIAAKLAEKDAERAKAALTSVLAAVKDPRVRQQAQEAINDLTKHEAHILAWLGAGPYQEKGKDARALFDLAFPPEKPDAKDVKWKRLTRGVGDWSINLDAAIANADDVAGYVRTRVWSPVDQAARLELGSDDAIKAWLNGKLVHANDTDRGVTARQDLVKVKLQKGWNELMLKVIDHQGGWAFCCRIRKPDGSALDGLKVEAK